MPALVILALLRLPKVTARTGLARSTIYKKVADGEFPPPVQLSAHAVGWREEEVEEWIRSRPVADVAHPGRELQENGTGR